MRNLFPCVLSKKIHPVYRVIMIKQSFRLAFLLSMSMTATCSFLLLGFGIYKSSLQEVPSLMMAIFFVSFMLIPIVGCLLYILKHIFSHDEDLSYFLMILSWIIAQLCTMELLTTSKPLFFTLVLGGICHFVIWSAFFYHAITQKDPSPEKEPQPEESSSATSSPYPIDNVLETTTISHC